MEVYPVKAHPTIGCCGLDCVLCPRYRLLAEPACPRCCGPQFLKNHSACTIASCCVRQNKIEVCIDCAEYRCEKFSPSLAWNGESGSFSTLEKAQVNLDFIRDIRLERFLKLQRLRGRLLETMIKDFGDGQSEVFYCTAATLLTISGLERSLQEANKRVRADKIRATDRKAKGEILKRFLNAEAYNLGATISSWKWLNCHD